MRAAGTAGRGSGRWRVYEGSMEGREREGDKTVLLEVQ